VPRVEAGSTSVWAQYTLRVGAARRNAIASALKARGIPTAVYYPLPLHQQTAYRAFPTAGNGCPVSERLATEVLSLPMHPYLGEEIQDRIIATTAELLTGSHVA
jgi:dTDP-4-amino-4,6-dideoxygalactose transaminase